MLKIIENLKSLVATTDFFYSTKLLRYEQENQYKTFTGGVISLAIIITIVMGFANMILNTLNLNTFTISTETVKNPVPILTNVEINEGSRFRMAFEVWRHNLSDTKRYFDVTFFLNYQQYGHTINYTHFPLQPCNQHYFKDYPEISDNFERLQASDWLCLPLNTTLTLEGKYSSATYFQYVVKVSACKNETDPQRPCASPQQIADFFAQNQNFLYFTVYFSNTQINPDKKDYKKYYIADENYALFGSNIGSETFLYLSDYTVTTDYSIWPFTSIEADSGCYAQNLAINHPFETSIDNTFITFNIVKSLNSVIYTRQVQKLSAVFSFIGGMIGAVSAVLFVVKAYTNLSYQFSMAFEIFIKNKQLKLASQRAQQTSSERTELQPTSEKQIKSLIDMNIYNFFKYYIYACLEDLGCKFRQTDMRYAKQCKDEILKQLDVRFLLQRIIFLEHCMNYMIDDCQLYALQLKRPESLEQIKQLRVKFKSVLDLQPEFHFFEESEKKKAKSQAVIVQEVHNNLFQGSPQELRHVRATATIRKYKKRHDECLSPKERPASIVEPKIGSVEMHECFQDSEIVSNHEKKDNKVKDIAKREKVKEFYWEQLQKNATEGGYPVSQKIWNSILKELRQK